MPGLGDTTAMLARLRKTASLPSASGGALKRTASFGPNPGQLTLLSYRPERLPPGAPLVVVLHGCTQSAEAYAVNAGWLTLADRFGFMILAAEQPSSNNPNRCFNWFSPGDVRRGEGEAASIASMVAHLIAAHDLDADRVFITGLSAGGAMTAAMLAAYPELFAGGAVIGGLPYGVARNVQDALRVMSRADGRAARELGALVPRPQGQARPPRLSIWHGEADFTVQAGNAHDLAQQWSAVHGLPSAPHRVEPQAFGTRSVWRSATGETLVELNLVRGLGHGTPLSTRGEDALGQLAPFMLEAGVSSSLEIVRFWGMDDGSTRAASTSSADVAVARPTAPADRERDTVGRAVMSAVSAVPAGVQETIAKALRAAGLLK
ncbi:extracellular catalytic domain type 1 short-chain-length polyhydroxyalkanoate depolymerase [Caulobacter segnis]